MESRISTYEEKMAPVILNCAPQREVTVRRHYIYHCNLTYIIICFISFMTDLKMIFFNGENDNTAFLSKHNITLKITVHSANIRQ